MARKTDAYREARIADTVTDELSEDGCMVAFFTSAAVAVSCAVQAVEGLLARGETRYRVGIHGGPVRATESLSDMSRVEGPGAALARDVMECGDPAHVLLSETTATPLLDLPEWADRLSDLGRAEPRPGLPLRLFSLVSGDVGHSATPTRVTQLIAARDARHPTHNLPRSRGRFVGREDDISEITARLTTSRFVALTGPPGIGKTRLAVETAERSASSREDGAWFVDLSVVGDPEDVPRAIARTLGFTPIAAEPALDRVGRALRDRDALLILDACEGVAARAAQCIDRLLERCPRLGILATSALPLGARVGEGHPVGGLDAARPEASDGEAVELFERRAYEADRAFRPEDDDLRAVADICETVGGSPLAIELVAPVAAEGSAAETLASLRARRLEGRREHPDAIAGVVAWAYDALTGAEQEALRSLSVFVGGFAASGAQAACGADTASVAEHLHALSRRGLVAQGRDPAGYRLPGAVWSYASSRRDAEGESDAVRRRLAEHFAATPPVSQEERADAERALGWAVVSDIALAYRIAARLSACWHDRAEWTVSNRWHEALLARREGVAVGLLAAALTARSRARLELTDTDGALRDAEEALAHASSLGDREAVALARRARGQALVAAGAAEEGMRQYEEALAILRRLERHAEAGATAAELAAGSLLAGDAAKAMAYCVDGLRLCAGQEDSWAESALMLLRGIASAQLREYTHAQAALGNALELHRRVGAARHEASCLLWQAELSGREADHHSAALYHAERLDVVERVGSADELAEALQAAAVTARRGRRFDDARRFCRRESRLRQELDHRVEATRAALLLVNVEIASGGAARTQDALVRVLSKGADGVEAALCVEALGAAAHLSDLPEEAVTLLAAATRWRDDNDATAARDLAALSGDAADAARSELRRAMRPEAYSRAVELGAAMTVDDATAYGRARMGL